MVGEREEIRDGKRYKVIHRWDHPFERPKFYIWDKWRELTRREWWYPEDSSTTEEARRGARDACIERFKELEEMVPNVIS